MVGENNRHLLLLPFVTEGDQALRILHDLRIGRALLCRFLLGGTATLNLPSCGG
jgi:hypothetical protein